MMHIRGGSLNKFDWKLNIQEDKEALSNSMYSFFEISALFAFWFVLRSLSHSSSPFGHLCIYLSLSLCMCVSTYSLFSLSDCLSVCLFTSPSFSFFLFADLSACFRVYLFLSLSLPVCFSMHQFVSLSVLLYIYVCILFLSFLSDSIFFL